MGADAAAEGRSVAALWLKFRVRLLSFNCLIINVYFGFLGRHLLRVARSFGGRCLLLQAAALKVQVSS